MATTNNYFRIVGADTCLFFDDTDYNSITTAYNQLAAPLGTPAINFVLFRPCAVEGPWNNTPLVGHRDRAEIMADIELSRNAEECVAFSLELDALRRRFDELVPS